MRYTIIIIVLSASIVSCKNENAETNATATKEHLKTYPNIAKANWMLGSWGDTTKDGTLYEAWKKESDSVYKGESFFIIGKDTVFAEYVDLAETNGKLTYTVSVKNQNNEAPVAFEMTSINNNQVVFENPKHDFPNKIVYNKISNDSLVATISGLKKGKPATETFAMKRHK